MPESCSVDECKYTSRVLCHCCNKNLCIDHLKQHDETLHSQTNPLVDDINTLNDQLATINVDELTHNCREALKTWRDNAHNMIDQFYDKKSNELNRRCIRRLDTLQSELNQISAKMTKLIREQDLSVDSLETMTLNIWDVQRKLMKIRERPLDVKLDPLLVSDNSISIEDSRLYELDLSKISKPYRQIECRDKSWPAMASNDQVLLVDQYPNISLYDRDLNVVQQSPWSYGFIRSMCWSSALASFIVINAEKELFLVRENSLSIERIHTSEEQYWWSCAASDKSVFLTNTTMGTNIFEYSLSSSFQLIKQWKPPQSCKKQEYIDDICYSNGTLALVIKASSNNSVALELRSAVTQERLWIFSLNINKTWFQQTIRCCSLGFDEWLVIEGNTSHIFHVLKNGKSKAILKYKPSPLHAVLFGQNILAIRNKMNISFYRL